MLGRKAITSPGLALVSCIFLAACGGSGKPAGDPSSPLVISTSALPGGTIGTAYNARLSASGGTATLTWSITSGSLPVGLSLNASSGAITGTPTAAGTANFTVQVADSEASPATATANLSIAVLSPLLITTASLPPGLAMVSYNATLIAAGGKQPYTWTITFGSLPTGLNVDPSSGAITGTPTAAGTVNFKVQVADSQASPTTATANLSIMILNPLLITTNSPPPGVAMVSYNATLIATGGKQPYTWTITSGSLPAGLSLNASSGAIIGTPTAAGTANFTVQVADSEASPVAATANLTITVLADVVTDVVTYHYDAARQGVTQFETILTLSNVNSKTFGLIRFLPVDGKVDAQPLYLYSVSIGTSTHNILYIATENDSVYAFDADQGQQLWKTSTLLAGETPSDDLGCPLIAPQIGITSTPVIDRQLGTDGTIYLVAMSKDSSGNYHQRLHALDVTTGAEEFGGPTEIQATYPGTGDDSEHGTLLFDPQQYAERVGLLESGGKIYLAFTSHCDNRPYTGWVMAYDAVKLQQTSVLNLTPNGNSGAIWMSGAGPAADSQGNIYLLDANGTFDTTLNGQGMPINGDYGNAFLKLSPSPTLAVADYFTMSYTMSESENDSDLGSGGVIVLPDLYDNNGQLHHLAVGAGKDTSIYLANRDNMGKFHPDNDDAIYQELDDALPGGIWAAPAFFDNTVYYGDAGGTLKAFAINNAKLSTTPTSQTATTFPYPGVTPSISANLGSNAIVWAVENNTPAVLHAYDASNLATELYNSNQAGARDQFGPGNKFITPVIINGKVFVGTQMGVAEFGPLQ